MARNGGLKSLFQKKDSDGSDGSQNGGAGGTPKWSMGVLNDKNTIEVPGKQRPSSVVRVVQIY